jgi:IS5 family transposase
VILLVLDCKVSYYPGKNPAISSRDMKPIKRPPEQDDLLRARLVEMIDMRHELVKLAALIDWEIFEREWVGLFPSSVGRPATPTRLVAGLFYLQHAFGLSDEAVVARWAENPYWQHFCGETFFQHRLPIDPSSMTRWRNRIGEEGVEWLLTETIKAGQRAGTVQPCRLLAETVSRALEYAQRTRRNQSSILISLGLLVGMVVGVTPDCH